MNDDNVQMRRQTVIGNYSHRLNVLFARVLLGIFHIDTRFELKPALKNVTTSGLESRFPDVSHDRFLTWLTLSSFCFSERDSR